MSTSTVSPAAPAITLESLIADREAATTPGRKAALTKQINAMRATTGDKPAVPSASALPAPTKRTKAELTRIVAQRKAMTKDNSTTGERAAVTRHARELAEELGLADPFPTKSNATVSARELKKLEDARKVARKAGEKAALTRAIKAMKASLAA